MSTFGEIVEPGSRTLWEDWDDSSHDLVKLQWQNTIEVPKDIDQFIIFEGKYLSDYINVHQNQYLTLINTIPGTNTHLYKSNNCNNEYICTIKDYSIIQSNKIIELLYEYLLYSREVIAILTKPLPDYNTTTPSLDCIIRSISTSKLSSDSEFSYQQLEQPNIISGVSAGVISLRDHMDRSATAIVCYIEHPEDYQIQKIQNLLEKFNFYQHVKSKPNNFLNSNLYI